VVGGLFGLLWRAGVIKHLADYVKATRVELDKCTWPTWAELKGSTAVVIISLLLLGGFTMFLDLLFHSILVRI